MSIPGTSDRRLVDTLRIRTLGIAFFLVIAAFVATTIAAYNKAFTPTVFVDLVTDSVGNTLTRNADVKARGVIVGEVRATRTSGSMVTLRLAVDPDKAAAIPANVTGRLLPKTLFGERYVDLVWPSAPAAAPLRSGMTLRQDASGNAVEVSQLLDSIMPLLQAIPPQYLASTLGALSQALAGNGTSLGDTIDRLDRVFTAYNGELPTLQDDLRSFARTADTYTDALPQLIDAFDNLRTLNTTIVTKRSQIDTLYRVLSPAAGSTADFLTANHDNIIDIAADSRQALTLLAQYSPAYACAMRNFAALKPRIDTIFGKGTALPGSRVTLQLVNPRGRYLPNQDEPRWFDTRGPVCFPEFPLGVDPGQYPSGAPNDGSYQPPTRNPGDQNAGQLAQARLSAAGSLSMADSPAENGALASIFAATQGVSPSAVPGWVTRIAAPALRGSEVSVQ